MKYWLLAVAIFASVPALATGSTKPVKEAKEVKTTGDQDQIKSIVETFRTTVINKDKDNFLKLFFSENTPWIGVTSDKGLKLLKDRKKDASQPDPEKIYSQDNPTKFMDGLIASPGHFEEKFSNVRIDTDSNVGLVYFDYSFSVNGYKVNFGKESWHLVHTGDGWKISSVIWSMDFNPEPPKTK
jgi:hypothetical protein